MIQLTLKEQFAVLVEILREAVMEKIKYRAITIKDIRDQKRWAIETFGPVRELEGTLKHIEKELQEIRNKPHDPEEWADLLVLAFEGAFRRGIDPAVLLRTYHEKMIKNKARQWPDYRTMKTDEPIEHIRDDEAPSDLDYQFGELTDADRIAHEYGDTL